MLNIQPKQWFQIISGSVSGLITGAALLNPLFGQENALMIVAGLGIVNIILTSVGTALSGQAQLVKDVAKMPGIEKITVNEKANSTLASVAVDPTVDKVAPIRADMDIVSQTARGNN
jgi:hypothetical protein